jgi:hypothetical protein
LDIAIQNGFTDIANLIQARLEELAKIHEEEARREAERRRLASEYAEQARLEEEERQRRATLALARRPDIHDPDKFLDAAKKDKFSVIRSMLDLKDCDINGWVEPVGYLALLRSSC